MKDIINNFREWNKKLNKAKKTIKMYNDYIVNFVDEYQITVENINRVLGTNISKEDILDVFRKLGFKYKADEEK